MTDPSKTQKPVPVSSSRNGFANGRAVLVIGVVLAVLLVVMFVPW